MYNYTAKLASPVDLQQNELPGPVIHLVSQTLGIKDYYLLANNDEEAKEWLEALSFACDESKKREKMALREINNVRRIETNRKRSSSRFSLMRIDSKRASALFN